MKLGIACLLLALLAAARGLTQGLWNIDHTGEGFLGYDPIGVMLTFAIAVVAGAAGAVLVVRGRRVRARGGGTLLAP